MQDVTLDSPVGSLAISFNENGKVTRIAWPKDQTRIGAHPIPSPGKLEPLAFLGTYFASPTPSLQSHREVIDGLAWHDVTPWQEKVLRYVVTIPPGQTRTYGEVAKALGKPKAARAVGTVMRTNPWPLIVPCHRVVPSGGGLGNYSGGNGPQTKFQLLHYERSGTWDANVAHFLGASEPRLAPWIAAVGPLETPRPTKRSPRGTLFESLCSSIVYQQLAGAAAATIHKRLVQECGGTVTPENILALRATAMRRSGVSKGKEAALRDLARHARDGKLPRENELDAISDDQLVSQLTKVRGVGPWTAQMVMIFHLGRPDVWPVDDYGVRKGIKRALNLRQMPDSKSLHEFGKRFRPHRSALAKYAWRFADQKTTSQGTKPTR